MNREILEEAMKASALECPESEQFQMFSREGMVLGPSLYTQSVSQDSLGCRNTVLQLPQAESTHLPIYLVYPKFKSKHHYWITELI